MPRHIPTGTSRSDPLPKVWPVTRYSLRLSRLPHGTPRLRVAFLTDFHACEPWVGRDALADMVAVTNGLKPDLVVLGGDYVVGARLPGRRLEEPRIARALGDLVAPLGVVGVLGNHDWRDGRRGPRGERPLIASNLEMVGVRMVVNEAVSVGLPTGRLWLPGVDSQSAKSDDGTRGRHDLTRALATVPDGAPAILLAHEPDIFADDDRVPELTLSGHTHGGQLNLWGWRPLTPSKYGGRYAHGHHRIADRQLVVSAGLGFSGLPMRIGAPPEVVLLELEPAA